jgi:hypothetical protein
MPMQPVTEVFRHQMKTPAECFSGRCALVWYVLVRAQRLSLEQLEQHWLLEAQQRAV